jgi:hypothetical protein
MKSLSITSKLFLAIGIAVFLGFSAVITQQASSMANGLYSIANKDRLAISLLLAQNMSGDVRWKRQEVIEKSYLGLMEDPDSTIAEIFTLDVDSNVITTINSQQLAPTKFLDLKHQLSIGRIKGLSTDVNFQDYFQYSINPRLISRIPSNPNNFSRIFSSFQAEAVLSQ